MNNNNINSSLDDENGIGDISSQDNQDNNNNFPFESFSLDTFTTRQRENYALHSDLLLSSLMNNGIESQEQEQEELEKPNIDKFKFNDDKNKMNNEIIHSQSKSTKISFTISKTNNSDSQPEFNLTKKKRGTGRKKGNDESQRKHNKFSDDNIRKKCKHIIIKLVLNLINERINFFYNNNNNSNKYKDFPKELKVLNSSQCTNMLVNFNKDFLDKTLKQIFSEDISGKFASPLTYNKDIIEKLENEEDEYKRVCFQKLFKITFLQCVNHFIGNEYCEELVGMKCFDDIKDKYKDEQKYDELLFYYFKNFKELIDKKRPRAKKENKTKEKSE
jgi:hypothetical protein